MKRLLIMIVALLFLTGCAAYKDDMVNEEDEAAAETEPTDLYDYAKNFVITENDYTVSVNADWAIDIRDMQVITENSTDIFVGFVRSKDGCFANLDGKGFNALLYTSGTIEVKEVYKGNAQGVIKYVRNGGIMSYAEYLDQAPEEMREKHLSMLQGEMPQYVSVQMEGDIPIETGKTYLIFSDYSAEADFYFIHFAQYGLREIIKKDGNLCVKNNDIGEYTLLKDIAVSLTE